MPKWDENEMVIVRFESTLIDMCFFDSGAHRAEPNTTTADLNEGPDPH